MELYQITYDSKERLCSYWHQIDEIIKLKPNTVLEVGIGHGFLSEYLKKRSINVTTCDIDKKLKPDYIGSVTKLPFDNNCFDIVACFEVLEHLPFKDFSLALNQLSRVSNGIVIISLPECNRLYSGMIQLPKKGRVYIQIPLPTFNKHKHKPNNVHYWEIGGKDYPLKKINQTINNSGLIIRKSYRVFECPYHRFFICSKIRNSSK